MKNIKFWALSVLCLVLSACAFISPESKTIAVSAAQSIVSDETPVSSIAEVQQQASSESVDQSPFGLNERVDALMALLTIKPTPKTSNVQVGKVINTPNPDDLRCLTRNMYFEARGEGEHGMLAVGHVVMNRVQHDGFPKTVCGVVKDGKYKNGKPVANQCQFSWVCDGIPDVVRDTATYKKATELAIAVLTGTSKNPVGKSLYFHATTVKLSPINRKWFDTLVVVKRVGRHIFYA